MQLEIVKMQIPAETGFHNETYQEVGFLVSFKLQNTKMSLKLDKDKQNNLSKP